jgi:hypothetical protein
MPSCAHLTARLALASSVRERYPVNPAIALALLAVAGLLAMRLPRVPIPGSPPLHRSIPLIVRTLSAGGGLFLLIGLLLGPGIDLLSRATLASLAPVTALAIGWVAAGLGARWQWRVLRRIGWERAGRLVAGAAAAFAAVALCGWAVTRPLHSLASAWTPVGPTVVTLAAIAAISGPGAVRRLATIAGLPAPTTRVLTRAAILEAAAGALVAALTLAAGHAGHGLAGKVLGPLVWLVEALGAGAMTALVYFALARLALFRGAVPFALLAALLVGSGFGWAAELSPFVVCAVAAGLIVNAPGQHDRRQVRALIVAWEPVMVGILALAAGAQLGLPAPLWLAAVALLAGVRIAAKWAGIRGALRSNTGLALLTQGGVALGLSLNFALMRGPASAFLTAAVLLWLIAQIAAVPLVGLALIQPPLTQGRPVSDLSAGSPVT